MNGFKFGHRKSRLVSQLFKPHEKPGALRVVSKMKVAACA